MIETSARLLRVLSLLQSRRFWSGADLAERLEVTARTVRRDVDRLRTLGYPVNATAGVAGGYQLGTGASLPPLLLDDTEALAVTLGLRSAAAGTVAGMEEAALRALAKLEPMLPARLRRRVKALHAAVVPIHRTGPSIDPELLSQLASACRSEELVHFRYTDNEGKQSQRSLEPHGLVHAGARWYLVGWDLDRQDWRTFRVDRVLGPARAGRRFVPRKVPGGDVGPYVSRSISSEMYTFQAKVVLHAPLESVSQRLSPLAGRLERIDAERCRLETGGHSLAMIALYIAHIGVEFEVQEPPELIEHLAAVAGRLTRASERASQPAPAPHRAAKTARTPRAAQRRH